jgi:hypothetical protein
MSRNNNVDGSMEDPTKGSNHGAREGEVLWVYEQVMQQLMCACCRMIIDRDCGKLRTMSARTRQQLEDGQ